MLTFIDAVKICLTKYVDIEGRASRSEYWWFFLFGFVLYFVSYMINQNIYLLVVLLLLLPSITVMVRRLHDSDMSGWWGLLCFIPLIGGLIILYFMIIKGTAGPNRFGAPVV